MKRGRVGRRSREDSEDDELEGEGYSLEGFGDATFSENRDECHNFFI